MDGTNCCSVGNFDKRPFLSLRNPSGLARNQRHDRIKRIIRYWLNALGA
jgi:hypothetical protein